MLRGWQHAASCRRSASGHGCTPLPGNIAISSYHRRRRARPREVPLDERALPITDGGLMAYSMPGWSLTALNSLSDEHRTVIVALFSPTAHGGRGGRFAFHPWKGRSGPAVSMACARCAKRWKNKRNHTAMTCQTAVSLGVYVLGAADTSERLRARPICPAARHAAPNWPAWRRCPGCSPAFRPTLPRPAAPGPAASSPAAPGPVAAPACCSPRPVPAGARRDALAAARHGVPAALSGRGRLTAVGGGGGLPRRHGYLLAPHGSAASLAAPAMTVSGANPAAHVRAVAALTATSWGTSIRLRVSGLPLNVQCWLVVRSPVGPERGGLTVWDAWSPGPVTVPASAAWRPSDIASLQVKTATRSLVTIAAGRP